MRTQLKINGEMKNVEIENGEITIIEPEKKATGWERAKESQFYNCIICDATSVPEVENHKPSDNVAYSVANYFSNRKLAENISRMQTLQRQMFRWQAENDVPIPIISKSNYKWCILYNSKSTPEIHVNIKLSDEGFLPCFSSKEKAKECIEVFKDELTWLFTEFRWRMDG